METQRHSESVRALDRWLLSAKKVMLRQPQELVRHEHALSSRDNAHVVDEEDGGQAVDLEDRRHLGLVVRVDLEEAAAIPKMSCGLLELRGHQLARATPNGVDVDDDGRRAVLDRLLKLGGVDLRVA